MPDRASDELRKWLDTATGVEVISRDRNGQYAEAATAGAPDAVQVADRFHLMVNLSDAVQRALEARHSQLLINKSAGDDYAGRTCCTGSCGANPAGA